MKKYINQINKIGRHPLHLTCKTTREPIARLANCRYKELLRKNDVHTS